MSLQYIIDAYNLINHPAFKPVSKSALNIQHALADFIRSNSLTGSKNNTLVLVFDGYPPSLDELPCQNGLLCLFSRTQEADELIKEIVQNSASPKSIVVNIIRISINNLAGVPSVVFGLFGFAVFVKLFGFGVSILSGSLTLGILALPLIISASQEALIAVPQSIREASLSLGATKWETIKNIVLPTALPGILTGVILSIGRVAGETAPILFTAAAFYTRGYPKSIFSEVMALPYHIYALMTEGAHPDKQRAIAYGCSLVLLLLVLFISGFAIFLRQRQRSLNG